MSHSHLPPRPYLPFTTVSSPTPTFDPKRITNLYLNPAPAKPAPSAPYIHLNAPSQKTLNEAREARVPISKKTLKIVRWISIGLRIPELVGAAGIFVCFLLLRGMEDFVGWIARVPPGVAVLHTLYSIYHLSSSYRMRTPASAASYHLFSAAVDAVLIAYYAFIGVVDWREHTASPTSWYSIFDSLNNDVHQAGDITKALVFGVFIAACATGGFTLVSLCIDLYIARVFRTVANLPFDMNPFYEDRSVSTENPKDSKRWSDSSTTPFLDKKESDQDSQKETVLVPRSIPFLSTRASIHDDITHDHHRGLSTESIPAPPTPPRHKVYKPETTEVYEPSVKSTESNVKRSSFYNGKSRRDKKRSSIISGGRSNRNSGNGVGEDAEYTSIPLDIDRDTSQIDSGDLSMQRHSVYGYSDSDLGLGIQGLPTTQTADHRVSPTKHHAPKNSYDTSSPQSSSSKNPRQVDNNFPFPSFSTRPAPRQTRNRRNSVVSSEGTTASTEKSWNSVHTASANQLRMHKKTHSGIDMNAAAGAGGAARLDPALGVWGWGMDQGGARFRKVSGEAR